jgi:hypothetical protein
MTDASSTPAAERMTPSVRAFQQAKTPEASPQFLQIVAKPDRATTRKTEHKLTRVTFRVSRLMEFCSKRELQNQTGHSVYDWPLVVLKEIMDNALDACEEAEVAPVIEVTVGPGSITIQDNADGFDADTIESILDYTIRVSSREAYVSPTRGAQGNALKTILAMGYVLDREAADRDADAAGVTIIETAGSSIASSLVSITSTTSPRSNIPRRRPRSMWGRRSPSGGPKAKPRSCSYP